MTASGIAGHEVPLGGNPTIESTACRNSCPPGPQKYVK